MSVLLRSAVSKEKRRYQKNGFDLDLSYVTPRIIAMGFPSENVEAAYRNPMKEVLRFLDSYHRDHYKVYNLCSERGYDAQKFYNRVGVFPFDDHNAPPFELILSFCRNVQEWLAESELNIAVIHCKAGKGRTGLMICAWLLFSREWQTPEQALNFYAAMRTSNKKGVTIPSQIRYVKYFHESLLGPNPEVQPRLLLLQRVIFHTLPRSTHTSDVNFSVHAYKTQVFVYRDHVEKARLRDEPKVVKVEKKRKKNKKKEKDDDRESGTDTEDLIEGDLTEDTATFDCGGLPVCGDIRMDFERHGSGRIFQFWFHTAFVKDLKLVISKEGLDKAHKDKHHKLYDENFRVELEFAEMSQQPPTPAHPRYKLTSSVSSPSILTGDTALHIRRSHSPLPVEV